MGFEVHLKIFMEPDGKKAPQFLRFTPFATSEDPIITVFTWPFRPYHSPTGLGVSLRSAHILPCLDPRRWSPFFFSSSMTSLYHALLKNAVFERFIAVMAVPDRTGAIFQR